MIEQGYLLQNSYLKANFKIDLGNHFSRIYHKLLFTPNVLLIL
jgi:hypothetical protein